MIKLIANVSSNGVIGKDGDLAVRYPEDLKYFKKLTTSSTVIMGRKTFESLNCKPLPNRKNVVISQTLKNHSYDIEVFSDLKEALLNCNNDCWIIGGGQLYQEALSYADLIHLTISPDFIKGDNLTYFPWINPSLFYQMLLQEHPNDDRLIECIYQRKNI